MDHLLGGRTGPIHTTKFPVYFKYCDLTRRPASLTYGFHDFLSEQKWEIDKKTGVISQIGPAGYVADAQLARRVTKFVQHWLFFELLREVFREDPKFDYWDFVDEQWITTKQLGRYLTDWLNREQNDKDNGRSEEQTRRMIRIYGALQTARSHIIKYCTVNSDTPGLDQRIWPVDKGVILSIMILGETLTKSLIKIQKKVDFQVRGWDAQELAGKGWGYAELALEEFKKPDWCPKTVMMLKKLMNGYSTGLLLALAYPLDSGLHYNCTDTECRAASREETHGPAEALSDPGDVSAVNSVASRKNAARNNSFHASPRHGSSFHYQSKCEMVGPSKYELEKTLQKKQIPLFRYDRQMNDLEIVPTRLREGEIPKYTVFSHVWKDGFGNYTENKMLDCTLRELADLCDSNKIDESGRRYRGSGPTSGGSLFWIDTLGLPVEPGAQRNTAIALIHDIYRHAARTVVLDGGLMKQSYPGPIGAAMRINLSGWITRLWTLQEVVLSNRIEFNFNDGLISLDTLKKELNSTDKDFHRCLSDLAKTYYYQGILGEQRKKLKPGKERQSSVGDPELVASLWRAVQWRRAAHIHQETLALAILLNCKIESYVELAGAVAPPLSAREEHMKRLLEDLGNRSPCAIPAGMIFLPGEKLTIKGFRWAPRSWLTSQEILSPDPLTRHARQENVRLHDNIGLKVEYPGVRLHGIPNVNSLFGSAGGFRFPVNSSVEDWYSVRWPEDHSPELCRSKVDSNSKLAIIAMELPTSSHERVGLLVTIKKPASDGLEVDSITRVFLSREPSNSIAQDDKDDFWKVKKARNLPTTPFGELLPDQGWYVDGPEPPAPEPPAEVEPLNMNGVLHGEDANGGKHWPGFKEFVRRATDGIFPAVDEAEIGGPKRKKTLIDVCKSILKNP